MDELPPEAVSLECVSLSLKRFPKKSKYTNPQGLLQFVFIPVVASSNAESDSSGPKHTTDQNGNTVVMYICDRNGFTEAYRAHDILNSPVTMEAHGKRRESEEYREAREHWETTVRLEKDTVYGRPKNEKKKATEGKRPETTKPNFVDIPVVKSDDIIQESAPSTSDSLGFTTEQNKHAILSSLLEPRDKNPDEQLEEWLQPLERRFESLSHDLIGLTKVKGKKTVPPSDDGSGFRKSRVPFVPMSPPIQTLPAVLETFGRAHGSSSKSERTEALNELNPLSKARVRSHESGPGSSAGQIAIAKIVAEDESLDSVLKQAITHLERHELIRIIGHLLHTFSQRLVSPKRPLLEHQIASYVRSNRKRITQELLAIIDAQCKTESQAVVMANLRTSATEIGPPVDENTRDLDVNNDLIRYSSSKDHEEPEEDEMNKHQSHHCESEDESTDEDSPKEYAKLILSNIKRVRQLLMSGEPFKRLQRDLNAYLSVKTSVPPAGFAIDTEETDHNQYILDPISYYNDLDSLEKHVIKASEWFRVKGQYDYKDISFNLRRGSGSVHCSVSTFFECMKKLSDVRLSSLTKSYLIICQVLDSFDALHAKGFCGSFFSILVGSTYDDYAEIIKIREDTVRKIKNSIGKAIISLHQDDELTSVRILTRAGRLCLKFLNDVQLAPEESLNLNSTKACPWETSTHSFRLVALILDLGIVTYAGSHGSRFDLDYIEGDQSLIRVDSGRDAKIGFTCCLERLACLDDFLDQEPVWVFRSWSPGKTHGISKSPLSILTHIEEFADLWGPVWEMSADKKILQYNVSKGIIVPVALTAVENMIMCHWYRLDAIEERQVPKFSDNELSINKEAKLLIGSPPSPFQRNPDCGYTIHNLEQDFGLMMKPIATQSSTWALDERAVGFTAGQYIGFQMMGTQKKRPKTTVKQNAWDEWNNRPNRANPRIFDEYLALEVSHCTGNSRRIRLRDLFLLGNVQQAIDCRVPKWMESDYGSAFLKAVSQPEDGVVVALCKSHPEYKLRIADIFCCILAALGKTGVFSNKLNAAFISNDREYSMPLDLQHNDWGGFLRDSHLTATYAIVNETCFECRIPDYLTGSCQSQNTFTALQTKILLPPNQMHERIWLGEQGYFNVISKIDDNVLIVSWKSAVSRSVIDRVGKVLESQKSAQISRELVDHGQLGGSKVSVLVLASGLSNGGLNILRTKMPAKSTAQMQSAKHIEAAAHLSESNALV